MNKTCDLSLTIPAGVTEQEQCPVQQQSLCSLPYVAANSLPQCLVVISHRNTIVKISMIFLYQKKKQFETGTEIFGYLL